MMQHASKLTSTADGTSARATRTSCQVLGIPRSSFYRWNQPKPVTPKPVVCRTPARALKQAERLEVRQVLNDELEDQFRKSYPSFRKLCE
jgi:hypothetical protein